MKLAIVSFLTVWLLYSSSIYSLQFLDLDANTVSMNQYQGKKILLVNIASGSSRVGQLAELQQLQQAHADSLVILGFPSNSFGHEPKTNIEIKQFCQNLYGVSFLIASKNAISGPEAQPIYNWLTTLGENQMMGDPVRGDFQKFLVNEEGMLIGVFAPSVSPLSQEIIQAITNN